MPRNLRVAADERAEALVKEVRGLTRMGVEIGVYRGAMSCRVLAADPNVLLFLVDPWRPTGASAYKASGDFIADMTQEQHDAAMAAAVAAVTPYQDRAQIIRETSAKASEMFDDRSLDFVFIDGDHSYEGCSEDIKLWWPKVRIGGLLSGHDYRDDKNYGVKRAVHEFLGDRELRLGANYTWFVTKWA